MFARDRCVPFVARTRDGRGRESTARSRDRAIERRVVPMDVEAEVDALVRECRRLGTTEARGVVVKFGRLVRDERCADIFEALNGTLRAAKKRKKITFEGEMLLQGAHDDVDIVVLV